MDSVYCMLTSKTDASGFVVKKLLHCKEARLKLLFELQIRKFTDNFSEKVLECRALRETEKFVFLTVEIHKNKVTSKG